jgi:hypothetical protein
VFRLMMRLKVISLLLVAALLLEAVPALAGGDEDEPKVANIRVQPAGSMIYVYYDLIGPPQQVYEVSLVLRSKVDSTFQYTPVNIRGDVGPNMFSGVDWRIAWDFLKEFPEGLKEDYYPVVGAKVVADQVKKSEIPLGYYIAGGAAVVAGVLALVLGGKKTEDPPASSFPAPPGRP